MRIIVLLIMGLMLIIQAGNSLAEDLPDTVFPWGTYTTWKDEAERDSMHLALGFNFVNLAWGRTEGEITDFLGSNMLVYPNQGPIIDSTEENYFKYAEAFYTLIEAEDRDLRIRFYDATGNSSGDYWYYGEQTADTILSGLNWWHRKYNWVIDTTQATTYHRYLHMKIDEFDGDTLETSDVIAKLYCDKGSQGIDTISIYASEFYDEVGDTFFVDSTFTINCGGFTLDKNRTVYYTIYSTGEAELYIDYLKVPDEWGILLIDEGRYDAELNESAYYTFGGNRVAGWYMADEPNPEQYRSLAYIDNLIKEYTGGDDIPRVLTTMHEKSYRPFEDFVIITDPEVIWSNNYVFWGGQYCYCDTDTVIYDFTAFTGSDTTTIDDVDHIGLQAALNIFSDRAQYINEVCDEYALDWWLTAQAFSESSAVTANYTCNGGRATRLPLKSELMCTAYMGLCEGAKGVLFWRYDSYQSGLKIGLMNYDGTYNPAWYGVKEMAPYIKAIEKTLLDLTWDEAGYYSPSTNDPIGLINDITVYSDTTNPDQGWFHAGEFRDNAGDRYFMLVNRACSRDSLGNEAPSVLAFIRIDGSIIESDFAYVIDLARGTNAQDWVGYPDTTLTAVLADGTIPYATFFRAGEGRLFKIVAVEF